MKTIPGSDCVILPQGNQFWIFRQRLKPANALGTGPETQEPSQTMSDQGHEEREKMDAYGLSVVQFRQQSNFFQLSID